MKRYQIIGLVLTLITLTIGACLTSFIPSKDDTKTVAQGTVRNVNSDLGEDLIMIKITNPTVCQMELLDFGLVTNNDLNKKNVEIVKVY